LIAKNGLSFRRLKLWMALKQNNYNRLAAAKALGMHKSTLFRKINKLKIDLPKEDGRSKHNPS